jgi:hypothetical protein
MREALASLPVDKDVTTPSSYPDFPQKVKLKQVREKCVYAKAER